MPTTQLDHASRDMKEAYAIIYEAIQHDEEAMEFVKLYGDYCHMIDDIIDEPFNPELILKTFNMSTCIFSTNFWRKHCDKLFLVECLVNNQYADVVSWEKSNDEWKRQHAQALSHCAYNLLFAVILIVAGRDTLRKVSEKFRTYSHLKHLLNVK